MSERAAPSEENIEARLAELGIRPGADRAWDPTRDDPTFRALVSRVDQVIDDHQVHVATLDPARPDEGFDALRSDLSARTVAQPVATPEGRSLVARPEPASSIVTRQGVVQVETRFDQARGFDVRADAALAAAGYRTADAVLRATTDELTKVTGLDYDAVASARADVDLGRVPGVTREAADLLRVLGVHSVSRLAERDPGALTEDVRALVEEHGLEEVPLSLTDEDAVARLVAAAERVVL